MKGLFEVASIYAGFGYHRTGTPSQLKTEEWLLRLLKQFTDRVERFSFDYLHYDASTEVTMDGRLVPSMPLYYEAVGELELRSCDNLLVGKVSVEDNEHGAYTEIRALVKQAKLDNKQALVVATQCANDSLYAFNVSPELKNTLPIILVPGAESAYLNKGKICLNFSAQAGLNMANNIIARFGETSDKPAVVITTPITGWFECAGERGTGIVLAIELAQQLSRKHSVVLVLASGHELGYLGGFSYTSALEQSPAAVIHLGSCLAAFNSQLQVWSNFDNGLLNRLGEPLLQQDIPINKVDIPSRRTDWVGEAECWAHFNCPMISLAGYSSEFHTPEDRSDLVTDQRTLEGMSRLLGDLMPVFLQECL